MRDGVQYDRGQRAKKNPGARAVPVSVGLQSLLADCQCEDGIILLTSGVASVFRSPMRSSDTLVTVILVIPLRSHSTSVSSTGTSNRGCTMTPHT